MTLKTFIRRAAAFSSVVFLMLVLTTTNTAQAPNLPNPLLVFTGREAYQAGGKNWVRYKLSVCNWKVYPNAMFAAAPALPPCGANANSSRTWVDVFDQNDNRLYGFCALGSPDKLEDLWFAVERGKAPPPRVYITLNDRRIPKTYKSNMVLIGEP